MNTATSKMPPIGFGTFPLTGAEATSAVETALEVGFRHIDTAQMYENEDAVGEAIASSGVPRDELYIVTKVMPDCFTDAAFLPSVERSLDDLGLDRVDLLLVHWPTPGLPVEATVDYLVTAQERGLCSEIGVSNFNVPMMETAAAHAPILIVTNQVEFHPLLDQSRMLEAARRCGVRLTAYCPLARGQALRNPVVHEIGKRIGRTPAQVVLRRILQQGVTVISMSTKRANMAANLEIADFTLDEANMAAVSTLTATGHRLVDPAGVAPNWNADTVSPG